MKLRNIAAALAIAAFASGCDAQQASTTTNSENGRPVTSRPDNPDVIGFAGNDPAMNAAIADAQAHLSYFWDRAAAPAKTEEGFMLKVGIQIPSEGAKAKEHIWVSGFEKTSSGYTGFLANEPLDIVGKKLGDRVEFAPDMISDWGFYRDGEMIGFYTVRIMLPDLPAAEAAEIRSMLGENPK
jgi:uncharacterized protein YegJ (DUF2314 family)